MSAYLNEPQPKGATLEDHTIVNMKYMCQGVGGFLVGCLLGIIYLPSSEVDSVDSTSRNVARGTNAMRSAPISSAPYHPPVQSSGLTDLQRWREMGDKTNLSVREAGEYLDLDSRLGVKYGNMSRSTYEKWTGKKYVEPSD